MFFFEKKNQKTFIFWSVSLSQSITTRIKSLFLLFFKKEDLPSLLSSLVYTLSKRGNTSAGSGKRL
jgi:hypothetical protein